MLGARGRERRLAALRLLGLSSGDVTRMALIDTLLQATIGVGIGAGLLLAALGLFVSELSGNEHWDGVAALGIGAVLALVAVMLGLQSRSLLLGAAASPETRIAISASVRGFPEVRDVVRLLTMQLGSHSVLVSGELAVQRNLTTEQIEDLLVRIDAQLEKDVPEVSETFWELNHARPETA